MTEGDYSPPVLVRPTPGGAAGDGSMNGSLTLQSNKASLQSIVLIRAGIAGASLWEFDNATGELELLDSTGGPILKYGSNYLVIGRAATTINCQAIFDNYNATPVKGLGLVPIFGLDNRLAVAAVDGAAITLYTTVNGTSAFEVTYRIFGEAGTVTSGIYTLKWTEGGVTMTKTLSITAVDTEAHDTVPIQPDNGTAITVQLTTLTGTTPKVNVYAAVKEVA